jgi:3-oxoacyl-[acyl-carrier protein] reductase
LEELAAALSQQRGVSREEIFQGWAAQIPQRRIGDPRELAAVVVFLASERASYITGTAIAVDGGRTRNLL